MQQKIIKTGNSLAVTVPAEFAKIFGVKPGDNIAVKVDHLKGTITYTFAGSGQMSLLNKK